MFDYKYVTPEQLAGFEKYKYSAVDTNPLSVYIMQHLWNRAVKIVPLWIAPNLLTFCGFVMILINYFILAYYDWDYTASGVGHEHVPKWVWVLAGFATFFAYTLDSIDGKHARRTNSSTPLGELFDHGLDSWATSLFTLSLFSVFGCNGETGVSAYTLYTVLSVVLLTFMLSHWEKYNTGVLFLPWGYDISQVTLTAVYLVTAVIDVEAWYKPLPFGYYFTDILLSMVIGCSVFLSLPQTLYNIYKAYRNDALKMSSLYDGLLPLLSPLLLFITLTAWVAISPNKILTKQPRLFLWMVGIAFSNVTCRVIICQMSNTRSETIHCLLFPLAIIVCTVATGLSRKIEQFLLFGFTALATAAHVHYGICVGRQLSKHFNIYIFSLKKRVQE
ncbi:ethanolaminephosphotransferase 1 isoform X1 [Latimeria chalumnae]|uniref:Ethanolaminephosphotransferase 1 n=1 Tax=Latimeria chalumnae TaxID=7897 RepID=H3A8F1_LATCH|nr:PREDICTED: ethanolaminephosphotransferase 1-like isoform X1 [Latimeria chalumnae]|eukprot:XP_006011618.1 PREDICTED: ethanolaminephosphotransferase 1-like isoform X1 [Latimeria chalumnae]